MNIFLSVEKCTCLKKQACLWDRDDKKKIRNPVLNQVTSDLYLKFIKDNALFI